MVLNGAMLPFAVLCQQSPPAGGGTAATPVVAGSVPHDTPTV